MEGTKGGKRVSITRESMSWGKLTRRTFLKGSAAAAVLAIVSGAAPGCVIGQGSDSKTLRMMVNGGSYEQAWRTAAIKPFEKQFGATVEVTPALSLEMLTRIRAEKGSPSQDLLIIDDIAAFPGIDEGLFEKLDKANLPNYTYMDPVSLDPNGYGPAVVVTGVTPGYNRDAFKVAVPKSWKDLWDPRYKGLIALAPIQQTGTFLVLLMANMIFGRGIEDIDAGIRAMKELKPNIHKFYSGVAEANELAKQGKLVVAGHPLFASLNRDTGLPVQSAFLAEGSLPMTATAQIIKGTPNKALAEKFINFALSPEVQIGLDEAFYWATFNNKATAPDSVKRVLPPKFAKISLREVYRHRDQWTETFVKEVIQSS